MRFLLYLYYTYYVSDYYAMGHIMSDEAYMGHYQVMGHIMSDDAYIWVTIRSLVIVCQIKPMLVTIRSFGHSMSDKAYVGHYQVIGS